MSVASISESQRVFDWRPIALAIFVIAMVGGGVVWQMECQRLEREMEEKATALKKLLLVHRIPPNRDVIRYLATRQAFMEQQQRQWLELAVAERPLGSFTGHDPQLYFQEQVHDMQGLLERLATARRTLPPEILGLPKELPPLDVVPRLLVQLSLVQNMAALIFDEGLTQLKSLKIEDPEIALGQVSTEENAVLVQLPIRMRFSGSLPQLMKVLGALQQVKPLVDLRALRLGPSQTPDFLDVDMLVSQYFIGNKPFVTDATQNRSPSSGSSGRAITRGSSSSGIRSSNKETKGSR